MTIGSKRQALLLSIALIPMVVIALVYRQSTRAMGKQQASEIRTELTKKARGQLETLVYDYGRIVNRDQRALEQAVNIQAAAVEAKLAQAPPDSPRILHSSDYDSAKGLPDDMALSKKHLRRGRDGKLNPIEVTYSEQVYFLPRGCDKQSAAGDMARLSTMPQEYRRIRNSNQEII